MADNYLITGYWGEPHVTAENDRGIQAGIVGSGRFVLPVGQQFRAEYIGNNTVRMYDGKLMDNGAAAGIPTGEYIDLLIANTAQNMKRNDLIVFQYERDASTLIESGRFVVIQGVETEGTAGDPALTHEDILNDSEAMFDQMALWRVSVAGINVSAPVQLFTVSRCLEDIEPGAAVDHTHGNISNDGKVGTSADQILTTTTGGKVTASTPEAARNKLDVYSTEEVDELVGVTVDQTVTADGTNPVSGAAVAAYVSAQIAAIADYDWEGF